MVTEVASYYTVPSPKHEMCKFTEVCGFDYLL